MFSYLQISVLEPHSAQTSSSLLHPPTILLEASNKCLSPIRELPTPAPSPALSPVFRRKNGDKESTGEDTSIFLSVPTEYYTRVGVIFFYFMQYVKQFFTWEEYRAIHVKICICLNMASKFKRINLF